MRPPVLTLVCCLIGAALLPACDAAVGPMPPTIVALSPTTTRGPTSVPATATPAFYKPSFNITQADYNAALARWQAQGIAEYVITTTELSLRSTNAYPEVFRVRGNTVTLLRSIWDSANVPNPHSFPADDSVNTVEGLFARIAEALNNTDTVGLPDTQWVYLIQFHPTLGYPTEFGGGCEDRKPTEFQICPSDGSFNIQVSDFKILARGTPPALIPTPTPH